MSGQKEANKAGAGKVGFATMLKLGIVLSLYAVAACVGLAFVYAGTERIISQRQQADLEASLLELFPDADSFRPIMGIISPDPAVSIDAEGAFAAVKNGQIIGAAVRTSRASYNGAIRILTGVAVEGKISAVRILEHNETPGLGANAASSRYFVDRANRISFYGQFAGKSVGDPFVVNRDVIIITASTITSRAVADSVRAAGEAASVWFALEGGSR